MNAPWKQVIRVEPLVYLERSPLHTALMNLAVIEAEPDDAYHVDQRTVNALLRDVKKLDSRHIALGSKHLSAAASSLARLGYKIAAAELQAMISRDETGPCAEITPEDGG
jgi:hypothetical protein